MTSILKKRLIIAVSFMMTMVFMAGCAAASVSEEVISEPEKVNDTAQAKTVGVALPTQLRDRWVNDGANMKRGLEKSGYVVDMQYADNDTELQKTQIEGMIEAGVDCLVVTPIDSAALTSTLEKAEEAGIPVIAYDRLLMDTNAVSYYIAFDNKQIGRLIGEYVEKEKELALAGNQGKTYTAEFFMGAPDDNCALHLYNGVMEVLQPYLDEGTLVCKSGKTSFEDTCTVRWLPETAQQNCTDYLQQYYTEDKLDICVSAGDGLSYGLKDALEEAGYTSQDWPVITGQDAEVRAVQNMIQGYQSMSVYIDTSLLAEKCVEMVQTILEGGEPEINDTEQYNNNIKTVPAYLCEPVSVDAGNYKEVLVESGYYTEDQIGFSFE